MDAILTAREELCDYIREPIIEVYRCSSARLPLAFGITKHSLEARLTPQTLLKVGFIAYDQGLVRADYVDGPRDFALSQLNTRLLELPKKDYLVDLRLSTISDHQEAARTRRFYNEFHEAIMGFPLPSGFWE